MTSDIDGSRTGRADRPGELVSWVLFLCSAIFFVVSALRSGDLPGLVGALLFLIACLVFLVPCARRALRRSDPD
ncbi:MAG: hypothetical protein R3174_01590 [Gammaproteobacteria bacterium]|nr:hypothetical protein [Gammaproteobacteria bacterium]